MKKNILRILLLSLSVVAVLLLAACGKSESADTSNTPAPGGDSQVTAEYAYRSTFTSVEKGPNGAPSPVLYTDNGYYAMGSEVVGTREIPEGETVQYQGQYDIYASFLYLIHPDGSVEKLKNFEPIMPEEDTEGRTEFSSYSSLQRPQLTPDGNLISLIENYAYWFDGPEDLAGTDEMWEYYKYEQTYQILVISPDGTRISLADVDFNEPDSYLNGYNAVVDADGNLLVTQDTNILAISPDGSIAYKISGGNDYFYTLLTLPDGRIATMTEGENGVGLLPIDIEKKSFGDVISLPDGAWSLLSGDENYDIYFNSGMYLYGYRFGEEEPVEVLKWLDVDISSDTVDTSSLQILPDGTIRGSLWDYSGEEAETELFTLNKVPASELPKKEVLTIAQIEYYDYNLNNHIVRFNRSHNDVRLELVDYSSNNSEEDFGAGVTKFTTELMAGKTTDIIPLSQLPYRQLAAKGLLEDLYPYIDKDPAVKREDFFPNVLKALEVNGGLYQAVSGFSVETLIGAASVVGDTPGWTYADYEEALAKMPEDCDPMDPWYTRDDVLSSLLYANMDRFVDWTTGQVRFESDEFKQLLQFASQFPAYFDWENYDRTESTQELIRQGRQMLMQTSLYSLDSLLWSDTNFGGKATYIGWPTSEGVGSYMQLDSGYAISKSCANKDAAWEFVRSMLTEEGQASVWDIPTNRNVYQAKLKELMTVEYIKDADGNIRLDENGEKIPMARGAWYDENGEEHSVYALSQEQADTIMQVIETCDRVMNYDGAIADIVNEQVQAFFEGQKSVDEVCRLIQSKANLYVNEQR